MTHFRLLSHAPPSAAFTSRTPVTTSSFRAASGPLAATAAFLSWGLLPIYWRALQQVPAIEILCHRIVWSVLFTGAILTAQHRWTEVGRILGSRKNLLVLLVSSVLVGLNWLTYIYAVNSAYVLEASLGYYINPLVNALIGAVFLKDRLRPWQTAAICLAGAGVLNMLIGYGRFPFLALTLALTFGFYALVRKTAQVKPLPGLFVEVLISGVPALIYLMLLEHHGSGALGHAGPLIDLLLIGAGAITVLPLLSFIHAARTLRLVTVGLFQYITPTCVLLLGVFVYHEHFTSAHLVTFGCIWCGIAVYSWEGFWTLKRLEARKAS